MTFCLCRGNKLCHPADPCSHTAVTHWQPSVAVHQNPSAMASSQCALSSVALQRSSAAASMSLARWSVSVLQPTHSPKVTCSCAFTLTPRIVAPPLSAPDAPAAGSAGTCPAAEARVTGFACAARSPAAVGELTRIASVVGWPVKGPEPCQAVLCVRASSAMPVAKACCC